MYSFHLTYSIHCYSAGLQVDAEEKTQVVALGNSTYLECLPKSHHATVTWFKDIGENSLEQHKVHAHSCMHTKNIIKY